MCSKQKSDISIRAPNLSADLVTTLSGLKMDDFTHFDNFFSERKKRFTVPVSCVYKYRNMAGRVDYASVYIEHHEKNTYICIRLRITTRKPFLSSLY